MERLARLCAELERLERIGLLYPAQRQLFAALAFTVDASENPEAEAEELLRVFTSDFVRAAAEEIAGCTCQASCKVLVIAGICTGCGKRVAMDKSS